MVRRLPSGTNLYRDVVAALDNPAARDSPEIMPWGGERLRELTVKQLIGTVIAGRTQDYATRIG